MVATMDTIRMLNMLLYFCGVVFEGGGERLRFALTTLDDTLAVLELYQDLRSFSTMPDSLEPIAIFETKNCLLPETKYQNQKRPTFFDFETCPWIPPCENKGLELFSSKVSEIIKKQPELAIELKPFLLSCSKIKPLHDYLGEYRQPMYVASAFPGPFTDTWLPPIPSESKHHEEMRKYIPSGPVIFFDKNEFVLVRPPRDASFAARQEYDRWLNIYALPKGIRNVVLQSSTLQEIFNNKWARQRVVDLNTFQIETTNNGINHIHTFSQNRFSGTWRYVGVAEKKSYREMFQRKFGFSF
jgi:hypothetical protein